jgi:hypothetical protein
MKSKPEHQGFFRCFDRKSVKINQKWPKIGRFWAIFDKI